MIHATEAEVHHELTTITKTLIHKTDIALHQETDSAMINILLLHNTLDHDMITTKELPDPTVSLSETELLPSIISNTNKHVHYKDPLSFNATYFELINYDTNFIIEHTETSDNRPYTNPNFTSLYYLHQIRSELKNFNYNKLCSQSMIQLLFLHNILLLLHQIILHNKDLQIFKSQRQYNFKQ